MDNVFIVNKDGTETPFDISNPEHREMIRGRFEFTFDIDKSIPAKRCGVCGVMFPSDDLPKEED